MKSKSPFANKSPLLAYKSDMRGNYANPKYVKEELVGVKIGEALTKAGTDIFSGLTTKPKSESSDGSGSGKMNVTINNNNNGSNGGSGSNTDTDLNRRTEVLEEQGGGGFSGQSAQDLLGRNLTTEESAWKNTEIKRLGGVQQYRDHYKIGKEKDKFHTKTTNKYENGRLTSSEKLDMTLSNPISMKGSPVKHDAGAVGSIAGANPLAGGIAGISQQISNQAQQRAADAGGSTSVDPFLPPPNQVAETGSYGGGGDRILEMDSNPVGNQSIGRDTDVASQLFGSGQRASMLAMKGTPLHTEGHGGAKGHTHAKPGDYLDQTVAEDMGVNDIEDYKPIQKFKGKQMVVNPSTNDSIFSTNRTFVIPKQMEGITRSPEGTPSPKPVYINRNKKQ